MNNEYLKYIIIILFILAFLFLGLSIYLMKKYQIKNILEILYSKKERETSEVYIHDENEIRDDKTTIIKTEMEKTNELD